MLLSGLQGFHPILCPAFLPTDRYLKVATLRAGGGDRDLVFVPCPDHGQVSDPLPSPPRDGDVGKKSYK